MLTNLKQREKQKLTELFEGRPSQLYTLLMQLQKKKPEKIFFLAFFSQLHKLRI